MWGNISFDFLLLYQLGVIINLRELERGIKMICERTYLFFSGLIHN